MGIQGLPGWSEGFPGISRGWAKAFAGAGLRGCVALTEGDRQSLETGSRIVMTLGGGCRLKMKQKSSQGRKSQWQRT